MFNLLNHRKTSSFIIPLLSILFLTPSLFAAGIEYPDNGTIANARGGAWAANPEDGLAFQYNPAGLAQHTGMRLFLDVRAVDTSLTFTPSSNNPTQNILNKSGAVSNTAHPFVGPSGAFIYGLGAVGPFQNMVLAAGATGPSSIGKLQYADPKFCQDQPSGSRQCGAARYALISSDYLIAYLSTAVAAQVNDQFSFGVTAQFILGYANFDQAAWSGDAEAAADQNFDTIAHVKTKGYTFAGVLGATYKPTSNIAIGLSFRPGFSFAAGGTLNGEVPKFAAGLGVAQFGDQAELVLKFPHVVRFGIEYEEKDSFAIEANVVYEGWSVLEQIRINTTDIQVGGTPGSDAEAFAPKEMEDIVFQKDFVDAYSFRLGGDYTITPQKLIVRAGYLYETSAIPDKQVSVDFPGWGRQVASIGASYKVSSVWVDLAYAHHFIPTKDITNSTVSQIITPKVTSGDAPPPSVVGNGKYEASQNLFSVSVRIPL